MYLYFYKIYKFYYKCNYMQNKTTLIDSCNKITFNVRNNQILLSMMCADIVLAAHYIESASELSKLNDFGKYIDNIYNVVKNAKMDADTKTELGLLENKTDAQSLAKLLKISVRFKHILQPTSIYKIIRIVNEFNIEHAEMIKAKYYEELLNKEDKKKQQNENTDEKSKQQKRQQKQRRQRKPKQQQKKQQK